MVHDHLDDVLIEAPTVAATPSIVFVGHHAGRWPGSRSDPRPLPDACRIGRAATSRRCSARSSPSESADDRRHNPGLDDDHVGTIVATCCVVLAIMRRLALGESRRFADADPDAVRARHERDEEVN